MGVKRLPKGALRTCCGVGKLMVKQGGFGSAESAMVPSLRAPLRMFRKELRLAGNRGRREMVISGRFPS